MTIKEVAKLADTSISAVSRVINNSGYVKKEVRNRIQKVLDETGYRPNAFAKALHQKTSHTIGVILPKINSTSSGDNIAGITDYISSKGYSVLLGNTNHSIEKEIEFIKIFQEKKVDGIILISTIITDEHKEIISKINIPFVIIGQDSGELAPCVIFDEMEAANDLTKHLIKKGRKNIAFIGVDEKDVAVGLDRKNGYKKAISSNLNQINEDFIGTGDFTVESGYKICKNIFERSKIKPDAIFAVTDKMAIGAINYLIENGYKIPEDISICGMGGGFISEYYNPKLTTAFYDFKKEGAEGAKLLYSLIKNKKISKEKVILKHKLIERESS